MDFSASARRSSPPLARARRGPSAARPTAERPWRARRARVDAAHARRVQGRADTVRDLVDRGADMDATDAEGYTALHCAAEAGRADVVDLLLKSGANAKTTTVKGRSAAEVAAAAGKSKVVRLLEKAGGVGRKEVAEKTSPAAVVGKAGSLDRRRRGRKGSSGAIRFGGGKDGFETDAVAVGWSH